MKFHTYEMNMCKVRADRVSCCTKVAASSRVSKECFLDVYG